MKTHSTVSSKTKHAMYNIHEIVFFKKEYPPNPLYPQNAKLRLVKGLVSNKAHHKRAISRYHDAIIL